MAIFHKSLRACLTSNKSHGKKGMGKDIVSHWKRYIQSSDKFTTNTYPQDVQKRRRTNA